MFPEILLQSSQQFSKKVKVFWVVTPCSFLDMRLCLQISPPWTIQSSQPTAILWDGL